MTLSTGIVMQLLKVTNALFRQQFCRRKPRELHKILLECLLIRCIKLLLEILSETELLDLLFDCAVVQNTCKNLHSSCLLQKSASI